MGGGAFIVARRGTVYVTPGPYLPIAKRSKVTVRAERATDAESLIDCDRALSRAAHGTLNARNHGAPFFKIMHDARPPRGVQQQ